MCFILMLLLVLTTTACNLTAQSEITPTEAASTLKSCTITAANPTLPEPEDFAEYGELIAAYLSGGGDPDALNATLTERSLVYTSEAADESSFADTYQPVWVQDITGDGYQDVIVNVKENADTPRMMIWIYVCHENTYQWHELPTHMQPDPFSSGMKLNALQDLTGDDLPELIVSNVFCGAHTCSLVIDILSWDGSQIKSLMGPNQMIAFPKGEYRLISAADGSTQIWVKTGFIGSVGAGPQREWIETYAWDGTTVSLLSRTPSTPPQFRFEAVLDGIDALTHGNHDAALALFERVLTDPNLPTFSLADPDDPRPAFVLSSMALYGKLLATAARDGIEAETTQAAYAELQASLPIPAFDGEPEKASLWVRFGQVFYETARDTKDFHEACEYVIVEINNTVNLVTDSEIPFDESYFPDVGYATIPPAAKVVCPF